MELLIVRHGESEGNAEGRMQGLSNSPLAEAGRAQAKLLASWLSRNGIEWAAAYTSPLARALETAQILARETRHPKPTIDPDLREIDAGDLEGLDREQINERHPDFLTREITHLGDFSAYGGESYDAVQERVGRVLSRLTERHREPAERALLVAHGGFNFQLVKAVTCLPVPRVCILRWGNCTASLLKFRDRRGMYMAEVSWHVPVELMGGESGEGTSQLFR